MQLRFGLDETGGSVIADKEIIFLFRRFFKASNAIEISKPFVTWLFGNIRVPLLGYGKKSRKEKRQIKPISNAHSFPVPVGTSSEGKEN